MAAWVSGRSQGGGAGGRIASDSLMGCDASEPTSNKARTINGAHLIHPGGTQTGRHHGYRRGGYWPPCFLGAVQWTGAPRSVV